MNRCSATIPSGSEGGWQFGSFESCEFSNITFKRLEPKLCQEIGHYKGNEFVLIATKICF